MMKPRVKKLFLFLILLSVFGCMVNNKDKAKEYAAQSKALFEKAIREYASANLYLDLANLYLEHHDYEKAVDVLKAQDSLEAKRLLAIALFKISDYTAALEIFERLEEIKDAEFLFYYGLTCEKLNLYEQAVKLYEKVNDKEYKEKAQKRLDEINLLEKERIADDILGIIKNSPTQENFPQASVIILSADEEVKINQDSTSEYTEYYLVKILNERGKQDFSEIIIDYDSTYERVELEFARAIKPDGTFTEVGSKNIRDVSKYLNFPLYSNARAYIISMPEMSNDCFIEYKAKIYSSRLIDRKHFVYNSAVQINEPIIKAKLIVSAPKDKKLNLNFINEEFNVFGALLNPQVKELGVNTIYSWEFNNIPQIIPEPYSPNLAEITPIIQLSTFNSWQEIYDWWWALVKDKIEPDAPIKSKVAELIKDKKTNLEKAQSLYNFCAQDIRYVAVEYGQAGFEPHKASEVFKNKYGDCKDQAILLITMLKEAGLKSYPVLIGTQGRIKLNEKFPTLIFNHAIAVLEEEGKFIFLDPTAETTSFFDLPVSDQDCKVLIISEKGPIIETTPLFNPGHNKVYYRTVINIKEDGSIDAERNIFTFGAYDAAQRYNFRYTMPIMIEENLKRKIQDICPGSVLKGYTIENADDINQPIKLSYKFSGEEFLAQAGRLRILPQLGSIELSAVVKDKREYKIDFHQLEEITTEIIFNLPDNLTVKYVPKGVEYKLPWMDFINEYNVDGNKLIFNETKRFKKRYIDADEYTEFKASLEKIAKQLNQRLILEEKF